MSSRFRESDKSLIFKVEDDNRGYLDAGYQISICV